MPLNLSTKPCSNYSFNSSGQNCRSNSIIWSPASMCEQEKSSDAMSAESENVENKHSFMKHLNNLKNLSLLQSARNDISFGKLDKGYFTHLQQQHKKLVEHNNANAKTSMTNNNSSFNGNRSLFCAVLNNNNNNMILMNDKETRPDSTAHSDTQLRAEGDFRRRERIFQVSFVLLIFFQFFRTFWSFFKEYVY